MGNEREQIYGHEKTKKKKNETVFSLALSLE